MGEINLLLIKNRLGWWEPRPATHYFPGLNFAPSLPAPLPPCSRTLQGDGEWTFGSVQTAPLCHSFLLTLFPCSSVGPHGLQFASEKPDPLWSLHGLRGNLLHCGEPPPSLVSAGLFSLSSSLCLCGIFLPFLKYVFRWSTTTLSAGLSHALQWVGWSG